MVNAKSWSKKYIKTLKKLLDQIDGSVVENAVGILHAAYEQGKRVYIIGNGGSASTATHMASDLSKTVMGKRKNSRIRGFKATALSDNPSLVTAWGNDTGFENIYSEQLNNLGEGGDVLVAISSSGNSQDIVKAVKVAKKLGIKTISISGYGGGKISKMSDVAFVTNHHEYGPVEDIQLIVNHILTFYFQEKFKN